MKKIWRKDEENQWICYEIKWKTLQNVKVFSSPRSGRWGRATWPAPRSLKAQGHRTRSPALRPGHQRDLRLKTKKISKKISLNFTSLSLFSTTFQPLFIIFFHLLKSEMNANLHLFLESFSAAPVDSWAGRPSPVPLFAVVAPVLARLDEKRPKCEENHRIYFNWWRKTYEIHLKFIKFIKFILNS